MRISDWSSDVCSSDLKRGVLNWDVTYYRSTIKGELLQFDIGPDIPASTFNAGRTLHEGVEAALEVQATEWLKLRQVYAYSNFRFRNDAQFGDNRLPVVPRSEEHTSELQSLMRIPYAVFCLKKKT